jgi:Family of unknown function (DUF6510)
MTTVDDPADGTDERRLDGNTAAGPLAELFTVDLSTAVVTCGGCLGQSALGAHHLYPDGPALVVRCPTCTAVVLRFAADRRGIRLEMTGTRLLTVPVPPD